MDVIQWNEELYERILIERTRDACHGQVDVVIDFGTTSRSLNRSIQCLCRGGVVFLGHETAERLLPKFSRKADEYGITIESVETGSLEQLSELVELVHSGKVTGSFNYALHRIKTRIFLESFRFSLLRTACSLPKRLRK